MLSRRTDYALRCLVELAKRPAGEWVATADLSRELKVSRVFLAKIFQQLVRHKVLESGRGKGGGVRLRSLEYSLAELLCILEPDFCLNKCLNKKFKCFRQDVCPIHFFLADLQSDLVGRMNRMTLAKLAKKGGEK